MQRIFHGLTMGQHSSLLQHIFNVIERNFSSVKIKCVLLQNRFHEKEAIEKDAFVPYSKRVNLDHSLLKNRNNGLNISLHCIVYMLVASIYGSVEQFTDLYFVFQGVQTLHVEIVVRVNGSTFLYFVKINRNFEPK